MQGWCSPRELAPATLPSTERPAPTARAPAILTLAEMTSSPFTRRSTSVGSVACGVGGERRTGSSQLCMKTNVGTCGKHEQNSAIHDGSTPTVDCQHGGSPVSGLGTKPSGTPTARQLDLPLPVRQKLAAACDRGQSPRSGSLELRGSGGAGGGPASGRQAAHTEELRLERAGGPGGGRLSLAALHSSYSRFWAPACTTRSWFGRSDGGREVAALGGAQWECSSHKSKADSGGR